MPIHDRDRSCAAIRSELAALLYDELDSAGQRAVEQHLEACPACRAELQELRAAGRLLSRWRAPEPADDARLLALELARRAERTRPAWRPLVRRLAAAAAGLLVVLLFAAGTRVRIGGGELVVSLRLPWVQAGASPAWEQHVRTIAADEVSQLSATLSEDQAVRLLDWSALQEAERARLVHAIDRARVEDQRFFTTLLGAVGQETAQQNQLTREALIDLASVVAFHDPKIRTDHR